MTFDWKSLVKSIAPMVGTALGGPLGGIALKTISSALLGKPDATEPEISAALQSADPATLLKLKDADNQFAEFMGKLGLQKEQLAEQDVAGARALAKTDHTADWLAGVFVAGYFVAFAMVWLVPVAADVRTMLQVLFGTLTGSVGMVLHFYFGGKRSTG